MVVDLVQITQNQMDENWVPWIRLWWRLQCQVLFTLVATVIHAFSGLRWNFCSLLRLIGTLHMLKGA
jgi:hypothetical protein